MTIKETKTFYVNFTEEDVSAILRVHNMACDLVKKMEDYGCYGENRMGQFMIDVSELRTLIAMLQDMESIRAIVPY